MKEIVGLITTIFGVVGMIGSAIAMRIWLIVVVILSILKLSGTVIMPWFAGVTTLGAISTGLWLLILGFFMLLVNIGVTALGTYLMDIKKK